MEDILILSNSGELKKVAGDINIPSTPEPMATDCYEQLCLSLYTYAFGTIGFDELLRRFEEILAINPPQTDQQQRQDSSDTVK